MKDTTKNDDFVFRFKLSEETNGDQPSLTDYYRETMRDLLKVVRFYFQDQPVIVDAFAFHNRPHQQIRISDEGPRNKE